MAMVKYQLLAMRKPRKQLSEQKKKRGLLLDIHAGVRVLVVLWCPHVRCLSLRRCWCRRGGDGGISVRPACDPEALDAAPIPFTSADDSEALHTAAVSLALK